MSSSITPEYFSRGGISAALDISKARINQLSDQLPKPDSYVSEGTRIKPLWKLETLLEWDKSRAKKPGPKPEK